MNLDQILTFLAWCSIVHVAIMIYWFLVIVFVGDWAYQIHSKWYKITSEQFYAIHYAGLAFYKVVTFVFFIIPYAVLRLTF